MALGTKRGVSGGGVQLLNVPTCIIEAHKIYNG